MKPYSLKTQLLSSIFFIIIIGMGLFFFITYTNLETKVDKSQQELYNKKIDNVLFLIQQKYKTLQRTGMVSAYEESFKEATLKVIEETNFFSIFLFNKDSKNKTSFLEL
jgi:hypothetical protein